MTRTILITRARGDENELTEALYDAGINVVHEPLTDILLIHTARAELEQALASSPNAVLLTSRHGARALAALTPIRDMPLLCVGESTLQVALSLGFTRASATGNTAEHMTDYILSAYDDEAHFVYASAEHIRTDLPDILAQHGMHTERVIVYEAKATEALSDTLTEHIKQGHIDGITFLSARTSHTFMAHARNADIEDALEEIEAYCMSKAIAGPLQDGGWKALHISEQPTLASLVQCVDNTSHEQG